MVFRRVYLRQVYLKSNDTNLIDSFVFHIRIVDFFDVGETDLAGGVSSNLSATSLPTLITERFFKGYTTRRMIFYH